jgi:hypothetical protein
MAADRRATAVFTATAAEATVVADTVVDGVLAVRLEAVDAAPVAVAVVDAAPAVPAEVRRATPRAPVTSKVDGMSRRRIAGSTNKAPLDADRVS